MSMTLCSLMDNIVNYVLEKSNLVVVMFERGGMILDCSTFLIRLLGLSEKPKGKSLWKFAPYPEWLYCPNENDNVELIFESPGLEPMTFVGQLYVEDTSCLFIGEGPSAAPQVLTDISVLNSQLVDLTRRLSMHAVALERANAKMNKQVLTDPLTGLGNRRFLIDYLRRALSFAVRNEQTLAVAMADLDYFKRVNDDFGHDVGDHVLQQFALMLRTNCRAEDVVARYGGEEFVIVFQNTSAETAVNCAERMRRVLHQTTFDRLPRRITVSFGVTELRPGDTIETLLKRVDEALYVAKNQGKNRVAVL
ncbi:MAG: GGDEF domain-containing protein [Limnochordia bacterium]|jgi:diguanylate cyclase (GGDEF)-like protein|nr:GGDEF domain-containing protein [Limnochordia bacterium]MDD2630021.1 GGDEF domain-containing protein [Limnochordia bacterium]